MNFQQVKYILAVSQLKSFGKAAEHCYITQSTLSTMIARYEKEIGIRIFDRSSKPVAVTAEGEGIIKQLRILSRELENLDEVVQSIKGESSGNLIIGVIPTIAPYLFPSILDEFLQKYSNVNFEISEVPTEQIVEAILKREMDIGLVSTPLEYKDLIEIPLYTEPFLIYDNLAISKKKKLKLEDLDLSRLWLLEEGHCMRNQVKKICNLRQKKIINGNLIYRSGTIETLMKLVDHNRGMTLLPQLASLDLPEHRMDKIKKFDNPVPAREIGLITHKHFVKRKFLKDLQFTIQKNIKPLLNKHKNVQVYKPY